MRRHAVALIALWIAAGASAFTVDFWASKPFLEWSDKEAHAIIQDSPWATVISVPLPPTGPVPSGDLAGGGRGGSGGRGDDGFGPAPRRIRITISWRSALPVKQALVRTQVGHGGTLTPDSQAFLSHQEEFYVVAVEGLPAQYVQPGAGTTIAASLKPNGRTAILASQAGGQPARGGGVLLIAFPRTQPLVLEDGEVEFTAKFDVLELKKKFKLKDMLFNGTLAL